MNVQELIDHLRRLPPDDLVLVEGYESGWDAVISLEACHATRQTPCNEWDGEYERLAQPQGAAQGAVLLFGKRGHRRAPD